MPVAVTPAVRVQAAESQRAGLAERALAELRARLESSEREWLGYKKEVAERHDLLADAAERAARELSASVEGLQAELDAEREAAAVARAQATLDSESLKQAALLT